MPKRLYELNPELEARIAHELVPVAEAAFDKHMITRPGARLLEFPDNTVGVLDPVEVLYTAADLLHEDRITPELVDKVRTSYVTHIGWFGERGVDAEPVLKRAGLMNRGTEDGIIHYHGEQRRLYAPFPDVYSEGLFRWSSEEFPHGQTIGYWGDISGGIPSRQSHINRTDLNVNGIDVDTESLVAVNAFTDPQEFDTFDAHDALAMVSDPIGQKVHKKVGGQELRHGRWFRAIGEGLYQLDPEMIDYIITVEASVQRYFGMPAEKSYPNFLDEALMLAATGLFTVEGVAKRQRERVEALGILNVTPKSDKAKKAQALIARLNDSEGAAIRKKKKIISEIQDKYIKDEQSAGRVPFILGRTVLVDGKNIEVIPEAA